MFVICVQYMLFYTLQCFGFKKPKCISKNKANLETNITQVEESKNQEQLIHSPKVCKPP